MLKAEFKYIFSHKILTATVCAMMIIPFLYAVFFLRSVWDPYGNTQYLPVAVVNQDKSVKFQGKTFAVGDQLVNKLKKNDDLGWHFVSKKQAQYGLSHKKYYMVITIPKNFSKNATTVLDKNPKKMQLTYKTNDSLNYIGEVISKQGATKVDSSIKKSVSTAYADTMFKVIKKVGAGFKTAATGSKKLADGSKTLSDGVNTYTAGVSQVNQGVIKLNAGVEPLGSGVLKLASGANTLANGISTYTNGVDQVNTGVQTMKTSVPALTSGVSQLASGSNQLTSGTATLNNGLATLHNNSATLKNGVAKLSQLPQGAAAMYVLNSTIATGLNQIPASQLTSMANEMASVQTQMAEIKALEAQLTPVLSQLPTLATELKTAESQLASIETAQTAFTSALTSNLTSIGSQTTESYKAAATANAEIKQVLASDSNLTSMQKAALEDAQRQTATVMADAQKTGTNITTIQTAAKSFASAMSPVASSLTQMKSQLTSLQSAMTNVQSLLTKANALMSSSDSMTNTTMQTTVKQLASGVSNLQTLAKSAQTYAAQLNSGVNGASAAKALNVSAILAAANNGGTSSATAVITSQVAQMSAKSSIPTLISGVAAYTNGVDQAAAGSSQLYSGSATLANGLGQLNSKVPTLASGVNQLASGTSQLAANSSALNSGANQLASGLDTLNDSVPTLTSGISQLASGTAKLDANSNKLNQGSKTLYQGNKKLASGLVTASGTVSKLNLNNVNAKMFASPTKLNEKHYSVVPNYGYALAPYMLSVALFVGSLVFNLVYPIRRLSTEDGTAEEWFLSKVSIGALVAVGNAIVETGLMMICGLHPDHPFQMVANAIFFSLTCMFLVMFLAMSFGNPGRFVAMILLVIQLGACGGSFPIEITKGMAGFYQAINPYLPMTYSVYGFREALTSGLGSMQVLHSILVQLVFIVVFGGFLYTTMRIIRPDQEYKEDWVSEYPGN